MRALEAATEPGSLAVLATFALDGRTRCSGLPVARYDAQELSALVGNRRQLVSDHREEHVTGSGAIQPFIWTAFRRRE